MLTLSTTQKTKQTSQEANSRQTSGELQVFLKESNYLVLDNFSSHCELQLVFHALLKIKPLYKNFKISLASRVSMFLLKKLTNFIHSLNPNYFLIYLLIYTKNSSLLCFMHNKGESVSKRLHFNECILKNMGGKWDNYSALVYGETETQRLRFCLISPPAAPGTLHHAWRSCHFFHNVIS